MNGTTTRCDAEFGQHPTRPHLIGVCTRPLGHPGEHSNVMHKPGEDPDRDIASHEAQIRDLLEEREELLTEIRRLRMGNHPAGRALERTVLRARLGCVDDNVIALQAALTERDAEHDGGEGA